MPAQRVRVLFFCEAVTLAHVARPAVLAQSLDPTRYEVHIAQHPRYRALLGELPATHHDLQSIEPAQFMAALAQGSPVYEEETLRQYVEQDRALIASIKPDIVVGDFRISLQVSARLAGVPFIALSNAYWSEFARQRYVVPDLPFARLLGARVGQGVFTVARPIAFALHCRPMNAVRRHYGLPSLGHSLQRVYTQGDYTLYADAAELFTMRALPSQHRFIGPIVWSPTYPRPPWWDSVGHDKPRIYVTLGSSGQASVLPEILAGLAHLDANVLVSTAGAPLPAQSPDNVYMAQYLSGEDAVQGASLVICNGGSPTTQQALVSGVPVLGLASNLDQYLNMAMLEQNGAGRCLRAASANAAQIGQLAQQQLADHSYRESAGRVARILNAYDARQLFNATLDEALSQIPGDARSAAKRVSGASV